MRGCVSSRQRFRSNCPVNAALHSPQTMLLALSSSRSRSLSLPHPAPAPTSLDLCFPRQLARSLVFPVSLPSYQPLCLLLMTGSRPKRDWSQLSSLAHWLSTLYILTRNRPLCCFAFSLILRFAQKIARALVLRVTLIKRYDLLPRSSGKLLLSTILIILISATTRRDVRLWYICI